MLYPAELRARRSELVQFTVLVSSFATGNCGASFRPRQHYVPTVGRGTESEVRHTRPACSVVHSHFERSEGYRRDWRVAEPSIPLCPIGTDLLAILARTCQPEKSKN